MAAIRLAIIGYGSAGRGIHSRLAREAGFSVTVIVTNNRNRRQQAAADWPGARLLADISELPALRDRFDLAIIASPTASHAENAAFLARAGIPFVVDKPLGVDAFEVRAIIAEAAATGTPFTVFQNRRWDGEQLGAISAIERGELGDVHTFERRMEVWRPVIRTGWKEEDLVGGGLLLDRGVHLVDGAIQLFGPVTAVTAQIRHLATATDDDVMLLLEHTPGGGVARSKFPVVSRLFTSTMVAAPGPRTKILGTKAGYVVAGFDDFSVFEVAAAGVDGARDSGWLVQGSHLTPLPLPENAHVDFYARLPDWLAGETPAPVDPKDALASA
ncbi:MAG: Gfo/Idh/MocA family oxidoreductase, partial [Promicromonosporaceae bacterium]|nr:Gfo/Idh/MocA family oxidoreductase [Promicromonosporaceae bacterium]